MSHGSEGPLWAGGVSQENSAHLPGEPPGTFFGDGGRPRDLFPLPFLMSRPQVLGASMSQRRRRCQNNKVVSKANEVVSALNGMYASSGASASVASSCTSNQEAALHEIFKQVKYASSHVPGCNEREAVRELLHSCPSYSREAETTVRPYDRDLVSLPVVGSRVPELSTLLDPAGREFLKDPIGCMMLTPQEFGEVCEKNRRIKPYMDVVLQNDTEKYQTFVHDLYLRGMLQFTSRPKDMACPFFVNKKNGRQRLVMDCRAINQRFRAPPLLKMAAGSSWSHVEIPAGKSLYIAQSDIKDYFYSIPLPTIFLLTFNSCQVFARVGGPSSPRWRCQRGRLGVSNVCGHSYGVVMGNVPGTKDSLISSCSWCRFGAWARSVRWSTLSFAGWSGTYHVGICRQFECSRNRL